MQSWLENWLTQASWHQYWHIELNTWLWGRIDEFVCTVNAFIHNSIISFMIWQLQRKLSFYNSFFLLSLVPTLFLFWLLDLFAFFFSIPSVSSFTGVLVKTLDCSGVHFLAPDAAAIFGRDETSSTDITSRLVTAGRSFVSEFDGWHTRVIRWLHTVYSSSTGYYGISSWAGWYIGTLNTSTCKQMFWCTRI